jgi:hypothetical protein
VDGHHEAGKDRMLENLTVMSDDDRDRTLIRNEDTLRRRDWIDRALAGVRSRIKPAELGEAPETTGAAPVAPVKGADAPTDDGRPKLYVVRNVDRR